MSNCALYVVFVEHPKRMTAEALNDIHSILLANPLLRIEARVRVHP